MQVQACDPVAHRVRLERLLNASFVYLGLAELKDVPLAVMERLEQVGLCFAFWMYSCTFDKCPPPIYLMRVRALPADSSIMQHTFA